MDDRTTEERIAGTLNELRDNELAQLLEDVRRMADGFDGLSQLLVAAHSKDGRALRDLTRPLMLAAVERCRAALSTAIDAQADRVAVNVDDLLTMSTLLYEAGWRK